MNAGIYISTMESQMKSPLLQEIEDTVRQQMKHDKDIINAAAENMSSYANNVIELLIMQ